MKASVTSLLILTAFLSAVQTRAQRGPMPDMTHDQFTKQADGRFAALDRNGDGALSPDEGGSASGGPPLRPEMLDTDKDGSVTKAEFAAAMAARFEQMDINRDGVVTADERRARRGQMGDRGRPNR